MERKLTVACEVHPWQVGAPLGRRQDGCVLDMAWRGAHNTERPVGVIPTKPKWEIRVEI